MVETCFCCGRTEGVELEDSRTYYGVKEEPPQTRFERILEVPKEEPTDPNAPIPLCRSCAKDHHEYWDEMWASYYQSTW